MSRRRRRVRWLSFCLLTGVLFQTTATSCSDLGIAVAATLSTSIANAAIRETVNQAFGLSSTGLSGLGT